MTGVLDNGNAEIEYTYYLAGVGGMVSCVGESTYGPTSAAAVAATPTFSPAPGVFASSELVTLSDITPGAVIYYTTNGTTPTAYSSVYNSPIEVSATTTIESIAVVPGYNNSAIAAGTYFSGQSQNITFPVGSIQTYPASPITLSATASSGLPVSYAIVSGTATLSGTLLTISHPGSVTVQATQAGNARFAPAQSVLQTFTVNPENTTLALASSNNSSYLGASVTFTAAITPQLGGQATGSVTFTNGSTTLATVVVTGNAAKLTTSAFAAGTNPITATYSGNANFAASTSSLAQVAVQPTITLASSVNPSVSGKSVSLTAVVTSSAGTPVGTVTFLNVATALATLTLNAGVAKLTTTNLPPGSNVITAVYNGKALAGVSTSVPLTQTVVAATTTSMTSSSNPSSYGQSVILTATVGSSIGAPPDGETVTFEQGTTVLGTGMLSGGIATFSISTLGVGTKALRAVYSGDTGFGSSTSSAVSQVIAKAASSTTLISSQILSSAGQSVTFTATVAATFGGTPTGTVIFKNGVTTLGTAALSGGSAHYTTSKLAAGMLSISATYNGSPDFTVSTTTLTQTVN